MKISRIGLGGSLAIVLLACGGSEPPAQTGGAPASPPSPGDGTAAPASPDPPASADVAAGIRAFDAGNYAEARKSFEASARKNPNDYEALYNLGMACEKLGDPPAAESAYKAALVVKPDFESAAVALSSIYLDAGRNDEALGTARIALARHPGSAALHENMGVALA